MTPDYTYCGAATAWLVCSLCGAVVCPDGRMQHTAFHVELAGAVETELRRTARKRAYIDSLTAQQDRESM